MTTPQKHQKLYDWLVEQPLGCETHHATLTSAHNKCAIEALKELTSMIMCSSNKDISAFIESTRAGIREKAVAQNGEHASEDQDFLCTD